MATDPSEEKKMELLADDLTSLENYIHDLFSFSPLPICFISPIGVILEINPAFEKISNFKIYEAIGEPLEKIFPRKEAEELLKETLEQETVEGKEILFSPKGKEKIFVQAFTRVRKDEKGEVVGFFMGIFDLTHIKKTEHELKDAQLALMNILEDSEEARKRAEEERNKTQEIVNSLTDGLLVFDRENYLTMLNPQAERILQIKTADVAAKPTSALRVMPAMQNLINLIGVNINHLFREDLKIREDFIMQISTIPLMMDQEKIGNLVILHDVSREKRIEKMKTEFVSVAAHQLRTPLSAIKWTLKMLLDEDLGKITEEQREFISKTYKSNERMILLINDLLNVSRIEEGRYLYKPTLNDIAPIIQFVVNNSKPQADRKKIKVQFKKTRKKVPKLLLDVEKIKLAIQNLVDNAIKYTPVKGTVTASLDVKNSDVIVAVQDNGVGIPKDQQERVFSKFFRGKNVIQMETDGSGLGLFIVQNVVQAHGGKIWFESQKGKGTTFYFSIPVKQKKAEPDSDSLIE